MEKQFSFLIVSPARPACLFSSNVSWTMRSSSNLTYARVLRHTYMTSLSHYLSHKDTPRRPGEGKSIFFPASKWHGRREPRSRLIASINTQVKRPESDSVGFCSFQWIPMIGARSDPNVGIRCVSHTSDDFRRSETVVSSDRILSASDDRIRTEPIEFYRNETHWKQGE